MANMNLNIRIDENLKNEFAKICDSMGMSMSTAFNIFAKAVVNDRKIPFEIKENNPIVAEFNNIDDFKEFVEKIWKEGFKLGHLLKRT